MTPPPANRSPTLPPAVPPLLAGFNFPPNTIAGMRVQAQCLVQAGDQPVTLSFSKDGQPLGGAVPLLQGVRMQQLDAFSSLLVIEAAAAEHSGNYSCVGVNAAATTSLHARLDVAGTGGGGRREGEIRGEEIREERGG